MRKWPPLRWWSCCLAVAVPWLALAAPPARVAEPWLSSFPTWRDCKPLPLGRHAVQTNDCGPITVPPDLVSITVGECEHFMRTATDTVRVLAYVPQCTSAAVERLAELSKRSPDAQLLSDLSGAYYIRAQRNDQPSDFVRALDAADRAIKAAPRSSVPPRFNRALSEEALGLSADAIRSWDGVRKAARSDWTAEAGRHYAALMVQRARSAAVQWPLNLKLLPEAVHAGDTRAVRQLVSPYRNAAQLHVEEELLPGWADAVRHGRQAEAAEQLQMAATIAAELSRLTHDNYLLESVQLLQSANPETLPTLINAHLLYRDARNDDRAFQNDDAAKHYEKAQEAFERAGSPLRFGAMLGRANAVSFGDQSKALSLLRTAQSEMRRHPHAYLLARVHTGRGFVYTVQGRYLDALAEYSDAQTIFAKTNDRENLSNVFARKIGLFRFIGHEESTWREIFHALRHVESMIEPKSRHFVFGESAASAAVLGYPAIGLRYQEAAVRLLEDQLAHTTDETRVTGLKRNLGIALRSRAAIRVRLGDNAGAQADLNTAIPLIGSPPDPREGSIAGGLRARLAEVQAQTLAGNDRTKAIAKYGEAIREASTTHYQTLIASLLIQRAELYRLDGNRPASRTDLQDAIVALRKQEQAVLLGRNRPREAEILWSAYFMRFQEAYRMLIRYLIDDGSGAEAFAYAEKARAFELLQLVLDRGDVPPSFRQGTRDGEPYSIDAVRQALPADTYVLEYAVLDNRTYVWIVGHDASPEPRMLRTGQRDIAAWTLQLQNLASQREVEAFEGALAAPYRGLLAEAIGRVKSLQHGRPARLVIIPDRSMHGLPFAALRNGERYLIQDYDVSVAASATLYAYALAQDQQLSSAALGTLLLFDDPKFNASLDVARGLPPLHATQKEAVRIRAVYAPKLRVEERKEENATIPELLRLASGSSIIHIAAHGVANPDVPSRSFLLLAPTENDSGALDGERLLSDLRLNKTRLVVLSACSSAGGTPVGPEGLAPLVRPLVASGVPGIIGTLWNVGENSATAELLVRFHRHYRQGHDAADALRLAQREMLNDPDLERRSVIAWAPFQMVGYASSPFR